MVIKFFNLQNLKIYLVFLHIYVFPIYLSIYLSICLSIFNGAQHNALGCEILKHFFFFLGILPPAAKHDFGLKLGFAK